jgi:hypothetical protein
MTRFTSLCLALCATWCAAIPRELLYPHGDGIDLVLPQDQDEAASPEIALQVPIIFYGETYSAIYVSELTVASWSPFFSSRMLTILAFS